MAAFIHHSLVTLDRTQLVAMTVSVESLLLLLQSNQFSSANDE
jgi:hypothetical protein